MGENMMRHFRLDRKARIGLAAAEGICFLAYRP